jgi:hypothetical protein
MMARTGKWALIALATGVVLTGPGIRDDAMRALWIVLGVAVVVPFYFLILRRRTRPLEAGK